MHPLEFIVSGRVVDLQTFLWDHSCKVQEGGVLQRMCCYEMGVGLNQGCNLWDVQVALSICLCLANSTHLGFLACSHIEKCGVGFFCFFFNFTCRMKNRLWNAQRCSFSPAVQGTFAGSLGFSGSAWLGWEEREGDSKRDGEENSRVLYFFCNFGMVCCSLGGCWKAGELLAKCVIFPERSYLFNDFLLMFLDVCDVTVTGIWPVKSSFL